MGLNLGALAAGVGAGYMAADKWKRDAKKRDSGKLGEGDVAPTVKAETGLSEPPPNSYVPKEGDALFADGGMVMCADPRWMSKKPQR